MGPTYTLCAVQPVRSATVSAYEYLLSQGHLPQDIVFTSDSAGYRLRLWQAGDCRRRHGVSFLLLGLLHAVAWTFMVYIERTNAIHVPKTDYLPL